MSQRYIGGLIYNPPGGFSGYFDGSGDYLTLSSNASMDFGTGAFTIECWVQSSVFSVSASASRTIIGNSGNSYTMQLYIETGAGKVVFGNTGSTNLQGTSTVADGNWHHVVVSRSGTGANQTALFVDGIRQAVGTNSQNYTSGTIYIGAFDTANGFWNGYISNLRIVKGAAVYDPTQTTLTVPVGQLQAITSTALLTCAYSTFRDGSTNAYTVTTNGNTAVSTQNPFPQTQLPNPALGNQGNGVYSMSQYQALRSQNLWPAIDPYFDYVTLMLHGNGTNGAQNNTFLDSSTNNFTITRNGNTTQGTFTPYGSNWSNYFDGSDDLNAPSNAAFTYGTSDFTIEGWFFITGRSGPNSYEYLFAQGSSSGTSSLGLYREGGVLKVWNGSAVITGTTTLALNTWNHIALSRSGTTMRLFLNGAQEGSATNSNSISTGSTYGISVGRWTEIDTNYIVGYVSNFRVVKGSAVYASAFTPSTAPLTAITNTSLLTCQSNRFIDNSTNNFTITRNGDVSVQRFSPFAPTTPYAADVIGGSGYFDGSGDYLTVPDNAAFDFGSGDFTISAWVYPQGAGGIVDQGGGGSSTNRSFEIYMSDASTISNAYISSDGTYQAGYNLTGTTVPNAWNFIEFTRSSGTLRLFVNGVQQSSVSANVTIFNSTATVAIGNTSASAVNPYTGYISDVRVLKGTGSATSTVPTLPLTAITNTQLLCSFTNGGIIDNAMMNDLETVGNAQISTSVSKFGGGSMAFDGSGDYLVSAATNLPFTFNTGDFTIECWLYPASVSGGTITIVSNRFDAGADTVLIFAFGTTNGLFFHTQATAVLNSGTNLTANTWQHVALCRAGGTVRIFLNGVQVGSSVSSAQNLSATASVFVGQDGTKGAGAAAQYNGYIDDLRITKYARYTANFTPQRSQWQDQ